LSNAFRPKGGASRSRRASRSRGMRGGSKLGQIEEYNTYIKPIVDSSKHTWGKIGESIYKHTK
jgi:hypothetical protein